MSDEAETEPQFVEKRSGNDRRQLTASQQAFLKAIDERVRAIDYSANKVAGAKTRMNLAIIGVVVSIVLSLSVGLLYYTVISNRDASRRTTCGFLNKTIERDRTQAQALIDASKSTPTTTPLSPEETAQRIAALTAYLQAQGFQYKNGQVVAPILDCDAYVRDPGSAKLVFQPTSK